MLDGTVSFNRVKYTCEPGYYYFVNKTSLGNVSDTGEYTCVNSSVWTPTTLPSCLKGKTKII